MAGSVPYFSQYETPDLAARVAAGGAARVLGQDPRRAGSGARDREEYICGMACLEMVIAARTGRVVPTLTLARLATGAGAYRIEPDDAIGG